MHLTSVNLKAFQSYQKNYSHYTNHCYQKEQHYQQIDNQQKIMVVTAAGAADAS